VHKAVEKLYDGVICASTEVVERQRVMDFAKSWIASKAVSLDATTASTYAAALEDHILPTLGTFWYDAVTKNDVQRWVDDAFQRGWKTESGEQRPYARSTVHSWFRVFRTMTRDAVDTLDLPKDPSARIRFPQADLEDESNALGPAELVRFLAEMRARYPQHYALVGVLAFTGLRFCHASAFRWEDWEEEQGVFNVRRKHVRGDVVASISRKKRAPRTIPVEPELASVLHKARLKKANAHGFAAGWMFPSDEGTLRTPNSLNWAWAKCLDAANQATFHGPRASLHVHLEGGCGGA